MLAGGDEGEIGDRWVVGDLRGVPPGGEKFSGIRRGDQGFKRTADAGGADEVEVFEGIAGRRRDLEGFVIPLQCRVMAQAERHAERENPGCAPQPEAAI